MVCKRRSRLGRIATALILTLGTTTSLLLAQEVILPPADPIESPSPSPSPRLAPHKPDAEVVAHVSPRLGLQAPVHVELDVTVTTWDDKFYCPEWKLDWGDGSKSTGGGGCDKPWDVSADGKQDTLTFGHDYQKGGMYTIAFELVKNKKTLRKNDNIRLNVRRGVYEKEDPFGNDPQDPWGTPPHNEW